MNTIEIQLTGKASTIIRECETEAKAKERLSRSIVIAEMTANASGKIRLHLFEEEFQVHKEGEE